MRRSVGWLAFLVVPCAVAAAQPRQMGHATTSRPGQQTPSECRGTPEDIPSTSFQLSNGLTVVLHEDRKAPAGRERISSDRNFSRFVPTEAIKVAIGPYVSSMSV